jgi:hypothetical protein
MDFIGAGMAEGRKTGGRTAGTPNKLTLQTRQLLVNVLADEFESLPSLLEQLKPVQRIDAICKLSKYVMPTMSAMQADLAEQRGLKDPQIALLEVEKRHKQDAFYSGISQ